MMGGSESVEFMVESDAGEDWIASCGACGYAANVEKATSELAPVADGPGLAQPERFATPGVRTIDQLASFPGGAPGERQIKTLVYVLDDQLTLVLLRGDHNAPRAEARRRHRRPAAPARDRRGGAPGPRRLAGQPRRGRRREPHASSPTPRCAAAATW